MAEQKRVVVFSELGMEDKDWKLLDPTGTLNQAPANGVIQYEATPTIQEATPDGRTILLSSLTIIRDGSATNPVFDKDFEAGKIITIVGNVVHLPEGAIEGGDQQ